MTELHFSYLKDFCCSAGACKRSCCEKWEIDIDKKSLKKYSRCRDGFKNEIACGVDFSSKKFKNKNDRCFFLDSDNLCRMIKEKGENYLCEVCSFYPRTKVIFKRFCEIGLSLSCETAARLILANSNFTIENLRGKNFHLKHDEKFMLKIREKLIKIIDKSDFNSALAALYDYVGIKDTDFAFFASFFESAEYINGSIKTILGEICLSKSEKNCSEQELLPFNDNLKALLKHYVYSFISSCDTEEQIKTKTLCALVMTNTTVEYFYYRGKVFGFSFDLLVESVSEISREMEFSDKNLNAFAEKVEQYYYTSKYIKG